ncbi:MAG: NAD(P)/FAD-dependent oxidoreductase [Geminicoccaceae bacterium]
MGRENDLGGRTIVIGAGIVGASIAYHLAHRGADVTVVDRIGAAAGATGKSFAWINAHHFKSETYHRLRYQSLAEYHRLDRELDGKLGLSWCGALSFDAVGEAFDRRVEGFQQLGYPAEVITHNRFNKLEPHYGHAPGRALHLSLEAAFDPTKACRKLLDAAASHGAQALYGPDVTALRMSGGRVTGADTNSGPIDAARVIVAAGVGAKALLKSVDVDLPMNNRPGVMLHSKPVPKVLNHVIWGDRIHLKQQEDGRLVIGEVFSEGRDDLDAAAIAEMMLADARRHLPDIDFEIERTTIGLRPIPLDGMPVVGMVDGVDGLYVAVMHSGVTLAPIVGRMAADELLNGVRFETLAPYRLSRFQDAPRTAASAGSAT